VDDGTDPMTDNLPIVPTIDSGRGPSIKPSQHTKDRLIGYVLVLIAACCWATSGVLVKQILENYTPTPLTLAFWRDFLSFGVLIVALTLFRRDLLRVEREDLLPLVGLGVLSVGLFHVLWVYAVDLIGVAPAHVFNYTAPAFVVLFSWFLWREPVSQGRLAAVLLTFAGCVLVAQAYDLSQIRLNWVGVVVGLGAGITWATYSIFSKISLSRYSPWTVITYAFGLSALTILLLQPQPALAFPWSQPKHLWVWMWFLALVPTVAGFSLYTWALQYLSASGAIVTATLETVLAAVLAYILFDEILAPLQIFGAALIVGGVIIITKEQ
jgi:drug/metabolite transporter (DMT)-like permease